MVNAVSGSTRGGALRLVQDANGGYSDQSTAPPAAGGDASSSLTFDDLLSVDKSATLEAASNAYAGAGSSGGGSYVGGAGGNAYASLVLTGSQSVSGTAAARGGFGATGGQGKAMIKVYGAAVTAASSAAYGYLAGGASAKTKAGGTSGTFSAYALSESSFLVTKADATAAGTVDGLSTAKAKTNMGAAVGFETQGSAVAFESASPDGSSSAAVLNANPDIAAAFGASPDFFAIDEFGGSYDKSGGTAPQTITDTINLRVDLAQLASPQDLVAGFFNATALGSGFTGLTFTLTAGGIATPLVSETFTSVTQAEAFFNDNALDLGSLATGPLSGSALTLQATFTLTTTNPGDGFYARMIIGDPPAATGVSSRGAFVAAMAGLGGESGSSALTGVRPPLAQPVLSTVRATVHGPE